MRALVAGGWILFGARTQHVLLRAAALSRPSAAAFRLPADYLADPARLKRTFAVSAYHAVGRAVWTGKARMDAASISFVIASTRQGMTCPSCYCVSVRDRLDFTGATHPYFRVRENGPILFENTMHLEMACAFPKELSEPTARFFGKANDGIRLFDRVEASLFCVDIAERAFGLFQDFSLPLELSYD